MDDGLEKWIGEWKLCSSVMPSFFDCCRRFLICWKWYLNDLGCGPTSSVPGGEVNLSERSTEACNGGARRGF